MSTAMTTSGWSSFESRRLAKKIMFIAVLFALGNHPEVWQSMEGDGRHMPLLLNGGDWMSAAIAAQ
jgi:hypothetical protein